MLGLLHEDPNVKLDELGKDCLQPAQLERYQQLRKVRAVTCMLEGREGGSKWLC